MRLEEVFWYNLYCMTVLYCLVHEQRSPSQSSYFQKVIKMFSFMVSKINETKEQFPLFIWTRPTCVEVAALVLCVWSCGEGVYVQHVRNVCVSVQFYGGLFQHRYSPT